MRTPTVATEPLLLTVHSMVHKTADYCTGHMELSCAQKLFMGTRSALRCCNLLLLTSL